MLDLEEDLDLELKPSVGVRGGDVIAPHPVDDLLVLFVGERHVVLVEEHDVLTCLSWCSWRVYELAEMQLNDLINFVLFVAIAGE